MALAKSRDANATQEIRANDILEVVDVARGPESVAPLAFDVVPPEGWAAHWGARAPRDEGARGLSTAQIVLPKRRLGWVVVSAMIAAATILAAAAVRFAWRSGIDGGDATATVAPTTPTQVPPMPRALPTTTTATDAAKASGAVPLVDIATLPVARTTGTIVAPPRSRLFVDGALVHGASSVVKCGKHSVKLGAARARRVEVPCGGELSVR